MINFSDCEGAIGTVVSARLYRDFVENEEKANNFPANPSNFDKEYNLETYKKWKEAFRLASDAGVVIFH